MSENQSNKHCVAYCLAQRFDISALAKRLSDASLIRLIKGALLIEDGQSWSVVFAYGAVVHWNVGSEQQTKLHQLLLDHAENPLSSVEEDIFTFALDCPSTRIIEDHIEIESSDPILIFALSKHGAID